MRMRVWFWLVCLPAAAGVFAAEPIVVPLSFVTNLSGAFHRASGERPTDADLLPDGVDREAATIYRRPLPGVGPAVLAPVPEGPGEKLWIDLDADGAFAPGESVAVESTGHRLHSGIEMFPVTVEDAGHRHRVPFAVRFGGWRDPPQLMLRAQGAWEGHAVLNSRPLRLVLLDADGDGRVAQYATDNETEWRAHLRFGPTNERPRDFVPLARTLGIAGGIYGADIRFDGSETNPAAELVLTPKDPPQGTIRFQGKNIVSVDLLGDDAALLVEAENDQVTVPTGIWRVAAITVEDHGAEYQADLLEGAATLVEVSADRPASVTLGGPLTHSVNVRRRPGRSTLRLGMGKARGIGGRTFHALGRAAAPRWNIRRPTGEVVASGQFEYG